MFLMKLEHYPPEKLKKLVLSVLDRHLNLSLYKIFFFGSRVRGDCFDGSDIDIGIEGPQKLPVSVKLDIDEALDKLPVLYKIELVDFKNISRRFKKEALKSIEYIN